MLNYFSPSSGSGYYIDRLTVPAAQIVSGTNSIFFNNTSTSTFAAKIAAGFYCVPLQWYIYNSTGDTYTQAKFKNGGGDWNSIADLSGDDWTILYPLDKTKVNHTHMGNISEFLTLVFTTPGAPLAGGLTIYSLFTAVPGLPTI